MADQYVISAANLSNIENSLKTLSGGIEVLDSNVETVNDNVRVVYNEIEALANEFRDFVNLQIRANRKQVAHTELVRIRQELKDKFGHYSEVRNHATGILQADDLGIVKKETITNVTEELMLSTPGYWLAPCLVALAAWINDEPDLAERALKEGVHRNDEKTSLFFALICRRADRKQAALKWTQRYLENQDEENLDRKTIIVLDAFASGLLGSDSEGVVAQQMGKWLDKLADKPGFVEKQKDQWSDAINLKKKPLASNDYTYLRKYSHTWPVLQEIMEGAMLHAEILNYFIAIFEKEESTAALKEQLDEILHSLVTDYDDEELPLRREEKFNQFVIDFDGDENRAKKNMKIEETAFETHKDFTQLLTDAAMKPESSHASVSTQKFSIALSKDWISDAYNDVTLKNRMKIPTEIEINVDTFNDKTTDGQNENELVGKFNALVDSEKAHALAQYVLTAFDQFCLYGGAAIAVVGIIMLFFSTFMGIIAIIAGIGLVIKHFSKKKSLETSRQNVETQFEQKRTNGVQVIRATLAEVVDFRAEFAAKDGESQQVIDFLDQISPEQYVRKLSESNRRIIISK